MKCRLLVLDVDGMPLDGAKEIGKRTSAALLKIQQTGIRIVLASGRSEACLRPLAERLELGRYGGFILAYNGCRLIDLRKEEVVFERRIAAAMIPEIERQARENGLSLFMDHDDRIVTDSPANGAVRDEAPMDNRPFATPRDADNMQALEVLLERLDMRRDEVVVIGRNRPDTAVALSSAADSLRLSSAEEPEGSDGASATPTSREDEVAAAVERLVEETLRESGIPLDRLNEQTADTLMGTLGIRYLRAEAGHVEATMPVDLRTRQPFGVLHGGATLALAETVAGLGSMLLCRADEVVAGMQVSGNHISAAREGDTVRAVGEIIHEGRSSHVWNVDVFTSAGKLVSSIRVVNSVMKRR